MRHEGNTFINTTVLPCGAQARRLLDELCFNSKFRQSKAGITVVEKLQNEEPLKETYPEKMHSINSITVSISTAELVTPTLDMPN